MFPLPELLTRDNCSEDLDISWYSEEGTVKVVTSDDIVYDTLSNGKIVARNLPGEIVKVEVDENETYLRPNFDRANNINFRDGDRQSSRGYDQGFDDEVEMDENTAMTRQMYNSPNHSI